MFLQVLVTEFQKLRRSKITWISWAAISLLPLVGGLFMWIVREPERAEQLGLLGKKAQFVGATADWPSYVMMLLQSVGIGGMLLVAVIATYMFGREYAEGTIKNMLALPVARHWFAVAKFVVVLVWFGALVISLLVEGYLVGTLMALPGYSASLATSAAGDILLAALVAWLLVTPIAWISTMGGSYLPPLGFTIFMLVLGMIVGTTGWGKWFPWSIAPLFAGVAGPPAETLAPGSLIVLVLTSVVGVVATLYRVRYADNTQ